MRKPFVITLVIVLINFLLIESSPDLYSQADKKIVSKEKQKKDAKKEKKKKPAKKESKKQNKKAPKKSGSVSKKPAIISEDEDSMSGTIEWKIEIKDDNGNVKLPPRYRSWWYVRLDGVSKTRPTTLTIIGDGWKGGEFVLPVYSYDRKTWHRMVPEDIINDGMVGEFYNYRIHRVFDSSSVVWVARYYPYPYSRLKKFIKKYEGNKYFKTEIIGKTAQGRSIPMITITDPKTEDKNKKRVWIHARTHPSETGNSFVIEGLVDYLLSDCNVHCRKADLSKLIFNIVPMNNIDGVVTGNARVTPDSSFDLERMWLRNKKDNFSLKDTCPPEVKAMHRAISRLINKGPEFIIALNLHSKNAEPDWNNFLYTNFKKSLEGNGSEGDSMFVKHLSFAKYMTDAYCGDTINVRPSYDPGLPMNGKPFPESWWWANFKDKVMAVTLETTSGYDGCFDEWVNYRDQMKLGESIAEACQMYYKYYVEKKWERYEAPEKDMNKLRKFLKEETYSTLTK